MTNFTWMFMSSWSAPTESIDFSSSQTTTTKSDFTNEETEVVTEQRREDRGKRGV